MESASGFTRSRRGLSEGNERSQGSRGKRLRCLPMFANASVRAAAAAAGGGGEKEGEINQ